MDEFKKLFGQVDTGAERTALLNKYVIDPLNEFGKKAYDKVEYVTPPALRKHLDATTSLLSLTPELMSAADKKEMVDAGTDVTDDILSGKIDMGTANRTMDYTGATLAALIPGLTYKTMKELSSTPVDNILAALGPQPKTLREKSPFLDNLFERFDMMGADLSDVFFDPETLSKRGPIGKVKQGTAVGTPEEGTFLGYDKKMLGTGEGSHLYSYGHYFGKLDQVVDFYRINGVVNNALRAIKKGDYSLARNAFEKVGDKDFIDAYMDFVGKGKTYKSRRRLHRDFLDEHKDKIKEGYGAIKTPTLNALEERTAHMDFPITRQSEFIQEGFRKTFEDINVIFDEMARLFPEKRKDINYYRSQMLYPSAKEVPIYKILNRGVEGLVSKDVKNIFDSWNRATDRLFMDKDKELDMDWYNALKNTVGKKGFLEALLLKNGIQGVKYRPGQLAGVGTIKTKDRDNLNYVMYNDNLIDDGTYTEQLEFDFGE